MYTLYYCITIRQMFRYLDNLYIQQLHHKLKVLLSVCRQSEFVIKSVLSSGYKFWKAYLYMTLTTIVTHCCFLLCILHDIFFILRKAPCSKIENEVRHVYLEWSKEPNQIGHFYDLILIQIRLHKWNLCYNMFYGATVWGSAGRISDILHHCQPCAISTIMD